MEMQASGRREEPVCPVCDGVRCEGKALPWGDYYDRGARGQKLRPE
jgi:hypothetical protein